MQKNTFLVLFEADFCSKNKNSPPNGIGKQRLWRTCCYLDQKSEVFFSWSYLKLVKKMDWISVKTFFFFFFFWSPNFGRKNRFNCGEDLFFWRSPNFDTKSASIWFKTDENLGQVCLLLFPAFKKAPSPLRIPGYAPGWKHWLQCPGLLYCWAVLFWLVTVTLLPINRVRLTDIIDELSNFGYFTSTNTYPASSVSNIV